MKTASLHARTHAHASSATLADGAQPGLLWPTALADVTLAEEAPASKMECAILSSPGGHAKGLGSQQMKTLRQRSQQR